MKNIIDEIAVLCREFEGALPIGVSNEIKSLLENNEFGVAIEGLCNYIYEYEAPISPGQYERIHTVVKRCGLPPTTCDFLLTFIQPGAKNDS